MFVEIFRLFIVLLAVAAGFELGRGSGLEPGNGAIVGATLGAMVAYVVGGAAGRLVRRAMGSVEETVERLPAHVLVVGTMGSAGAGLVCLIVGVPVVMILPGRWGWPVLAILTWIAVTYGWQVAAAKAEEMLALAGLSTRPLAVASRFGGDEGFLVDTSAVLDGRMLAVARAGFLKGAVLVPPFVLDELQGIADAQDPQRRRRGQRGLEELAALRNLPSVAVHVLDDEVPEQVEVDAKLVTLAKRLKLGLITVDGNLQRVAELQGVTCLNLDRLAETVRPTHVPGEAITVAVTKEGTEAGQGVGYLEDGTMVVVTDASTLVGEQVQVRVTSSAQTSVGRILFATVDR